MLLRKNSSFITVLSICIADTGVYVTMPQTWVIIGGSVLLPNVGGFLGGFITRSQIKDWYDKGR